MKTQLKKRYELPAFQKLQLSFDFTKFKSDVLNIINLSKKNSEYLELKSGRSDGVFCTYHNPKIETHKKPFIMTRRNSIGHGKWKVTNQLVRSKEFEKHQLNSNCFKDFIPNCYFKKTLQSWGNVKKVDLSILKPNGWWPAHIDFNTDSAIRLIIPIQTNNQAINIAYNKFTQKHSQKNFKEGEVWFANTGLLHTGINYGKQERIFVLATYQGQELLNDCF